MSAEFHRRAKIGGGVVILHSVSSINKLSPIYKLNEISTEDVFECCGALVKCSEFKFILLNIYRPPHHANFNQFMELLETTIDVIKNTYCDLQIVICGDLNIDNLVYDLNREIFNDLLLSRNLLIAFNHHTRVDKITNRCSQLDYFITDIPDQYYTTDILPPLLSDHDIIVLNLNVAAYSVTRRTEKRRFTGPHQDLFKFLLTTQNLNVENEGDVEENFNCFYSKFLSIFDNCFPKTIYKDKDSSHVTWVKREILESQEALKDLYWRTRSMGTMDSKVKYLNAKQKYSTLLNETKRHFYKSKIENAKNVSKVSWSIIRNLTSDENVNGCNMHLKRNDELVTNPKVVANMFNDYFVSEIDKLTGKVREETDVMDCEMREDDFCLWPVTEEEVKSIIVQISSKTSAGVDEVPCNLLRVCKEIIAKPLSCMVNTSFKQGTFPEALKTSKVVPIHKTGDKSKVENFRPVAVQSVYSKIFEIAYLKRLIPYLEKRQLLNNKQYGFRKDKNTTDAIFDLIIQIYENLDKVGEQMCIFYDMTKAFDLLTHANLLEKLAKMGIKGKPLQWIASYLKNRKQIVTIRHSGQDGLTRSYKSTTSPPINTGVPQGSNLGPVLFLLYVNDLPESVTVGNIWLFADDVSHLIYDQNKHSLWSRTQGGLKEVSKWCHTNKLLLNKGKTKILQFHNRKKHTSSPLLKLEGSSVSVVQNMKYLGISISDNLDWQQHIEYLSTRLTAICYMMRRLQPLLEKEVLIKVYYGCFQSIINYGIVFWGNSPHMERLLLLQKRIIRTIFKKPYLEHCRPLFVEAGILTLPALFILEACLMVRRKPNIFLRNQHHHHHNTRRKDDTHVLAVQSRLAQYGPKYLCSKVYNCLPNGLKILENTPQFKRELKSYLTKRPYYSLREYLEERTSLHRHEA